MRTLNLHCRFSTTNWKVFNYKFNYLNRQSQVIWVSLGSLYLLRNLFISSKFQHLLAKNCSKYFFNVCVVYSDVLSCLILAICILPFFFSLDHSAWRSSTVLIFSKNQFFISLIFSIVSASYFTDFYLYNFLLSVYFEFNLLFFLVLGGNLGLLRTFLIKVFTTVNFCLRTSLAISPSP